MKTWNQKLTTAVLAGLLTVAAAAPMVWAQSGNPGNGQTRPPQSQPGRPDLPLRDVVDPAVIKAAIAKALGLTAAELDAAHDAGTKLEDLAATQGVTFDAVQAAAKAAAIAQINQAVADGKIAQTMADEMIAFVNNSNFPLEHPGQDRPGPDDGLRDLLDHDAIKTVIAQTLGITVAELDAAHDAHTPLEELATAHGVTIEAVQTAAKAEAVAQISQAVTDGKITQTQADAFIEQINNSPFPLRGPGPDGPRPDDGLRALLDHDAIKAVIAQTLGITVAELDAAHDAHTPLEALATAHGVTIEAVQTAAKAEAVTQIKQAVTAGKITQEQADRLIEQINNSPFPLRGPHPPAPDNNGNQGPAATAQGVNGATSAVFLPFAKR